MKILIPKSIKKFLKYLLLSALLMLIKVLKIYITNVFLTKGSGKYGEIKVGPLSIN